MDHLTSLYPPGRAENIFISKAFSFIQKAEQLERNGDLGGACTEYGSGLQLFFSVFDKESDPDKKTLLWQKMDLYLLHVETLKTIANKEQLLTTIQTAELHLVHKETGTRTLSSQGEIHLTKKTDILILKIQTIEIPIQKSTPCFSVGNGQYLLPHTEEHCYALQILTTEQTSIQSFEHLLNSFSVLDSFHAPKQPEPIIIQPTHVEVNDDDEPKQPTVTTREPQISLEDDDLEDFVLMEPSADNQIVLHDPAPKKVSRTGIEDRHINYVASGIDATAMLLADGISYGASMIQYGILSSGESIKEKVGQNEEESSVPQAVQTSIYYAKQVTPVLAKTTGAIVDTITNVSIAVGTAVGNKISEQLASSSGDGDKSEKDPRIDALKNLASSGYHAVGTVLGSIDNATVALFDATADSTIKVLGHKYGEEVGIAAQNGFDCGKDVLEIAGNVKSLTPVGILKSGSKKVVTTTAKTVLLGEPKEKPLLDNRAYDEDVSFEQFSLLEDSPKVNCKKTE